MGPSSSRIVTLAILFILAGTALPQAAQAQQERRTENLFLVTLDGLRWQEVFTGADTLLLADERYTDDVAGMGERFRRPTAEARRRVLLPFFWDTIARDGQLYGNRALNCTVDVSNDMVFSYPGYNEILTGRPDDARIDSNDKVPNPNQTVLEVAHQQPEYAGRVAAFGSWDVFPFIVNEERSGIPVNAGFEPVGGGGLSEREAFLNELQASVPSPWSTVRHDAFTHGYALEYLRKHPPRLLYVAYGETDDFAHDGDYGAYLTSARRTDGFIAALWNFAQSHPQYRGKTTLVITTDHGRGLGDSWTSHGKDVAHAKEMWLAVLGPDTPALGEAEDCALYQNQVAATVAELLGLDYRSSREVGPVVSSALGR